MSKIDSDSVRAFIAFNRTAVLSTISKSQEGYPFGSVTPYDLLPDGRLIIWVARISEHYRNLLADSRASMFVLEQGGLDDPQPFARASVLLKFEPLEGPAATEAAASYNRRFPQKISHEIEHTFVLLAGLPEKIRWIGGFGEIGWVGGKDFTSAAHDLTAYHGRSICDHMNTDHQDALAELSGDKQAKGVRMVFADSSGFVISAPAGGQKFKRLDFTEPAPSPEDFRRKIIALLKQIRQTAG